MEKEKNLEKIIEEIAIVVKAKRIAIHSQQYMRLLHDLETKKKY